MSLEKGNEKVRNVIHMIQEDVNKMTNRDTRFESISRHSCDDDTLYVCNQAIQTAKNM